MPRFNVGIHHLHAFIAREGHARVPPRHKEAMFELGHWLKLCRNRKDQGKFKQAEMQRLDDIPNWSWTP